MADTRCDVLVIGGGPARSTISTRHEKPVMFEFADGLDNPFPYTCQVRRSKPCITSSALPIRAGAGWPGENAGKPHANPG